MFVLAPTPNDYLDKPARELDLEARLRMARRREVVDPGEARGIRTLLSELRPRIDAGRARCFLHNDVHDMNILCTADDELLALIDWGDAGWGDPVIDFAPIPIEAMEYVLAGYGREAPALQEDHYRAKMVWDNLGVLLVDPIDGMPVDIPIEAMRRFLEPESRAGGGT